MRRRVRLTEGQLRDMVAETVRRVLQEGVGYAGYVPTKTGWEYKVEGDVPEWFKKRRYNNGRVPAGLYNPNTNTYSDPNSKTGHSFIPPGPPRPYWVTTPQNSPRRPDNKMQRMGTKGRR